jgi:predicted dehydrogenase
VSITRRQFLQRASVAAAAVSAPMLVSSRVFGANDAIRVGVVGLGHRGIDFHIPCMEEQEGVKIVALCDPDRTRLVDAVKGFEKRYNRTPDQCADMRELLDRKDIDVMSHATQTYWHCLSVIWSCQAGKHVYVEKPASQYLWEGRQAVNAARKYNRIVQCGTQERSIRGTKAAIEWIRAGNLGKIKLIYAFCYKERFSVGKRSEPLEIPAEVDYDLWCGPAKKVPLYRDKLHYDCCFDWNTGGGDSVNQGAHQVDVARWLLGENDLPRRVMSIGGRFVFNDAADCPNTQINYYDYPSAPVLYEMYDLRVAKGSTKIPKFMRETVGAYVTCEGGSALLRHGARIFDKDGKEFKHFDDDHDRLHFQNFIEAVRANDRTKLHAEMLEGHISTGVCHTGNISYRLGKKASAAEIRNVTQDNPAWNDMFERFVAHLKANEVDVDAPTITLGPWLETVPGQERFKDNAAADALAKGSYRAPYTVPDQKI